MQTLHKKSTLFTILVDVEELPCAFVVHVCYAQNALPHFPRDVTPLGKFHGAFVHFSQVSPLCCFVQLLTIEGQGRKASGSKDSDDLFRTLYSCQLLSLHL